MRLLTPPPGHPFLVHDTTTFRLPVGRRVFFFRTLISLQLTVVVGLLLSGQLIVVSRLILVIADGIPAGGGGPLVPLPPAWGL